MTASHSLCFTRILLCFLPLFSCLSQAQFASAADKEFTVLCAVPKDHESHNPIKYAYEHALASIGYKLNWQVVSPARTFHNITHGNGDAICLTTTLSLKFFDSGVGRPLKTVLGSSVVYGWSIREDIPISEQTLHSKNNFSIGYLKNYTSDFLLRSEGFNRGIAVNDVSMAAKMLITGRLDVMILIETKSFEDTLSYWLERQQSGSSRQLRSRPVAEVFYTPYIHKRHEHLSASIEQALSKIIDAQGGPISRATIAQWQQAARSD